MIFTLTCYLFYKIFLVVINFISDAQKIYQSQYCKGAENGGYGREVVDNQDDHNECMKKCLELNPPALLFSVNKPYVCNKAKPRKLCKCWCFHEPGANGRCRGQPHKAFDTYRVLYRGMYAQSVLS